MDDKKLVLKSGRDYYPLVARIVFLSIALDVVYLALVLTLSTTAFYMDQRVFVLWLFIGLLIVKYITQILLILKIIHNWAVEEFSKCRNKGADVLLAQDKYW